MVETDFEFPFLTRQYGDEVVNEIIIKYRETIFKAQQEKQQAQREEQQAEEQAQREKQQAQREEKKAQREEKKAQREEQQAEEKAQREEDRLILLGNREKKLSEKLKVVHETLNDEEFDKLKKSASLFDFKNLESFRKLCHKCELDDKYNSMVKFLPDIGKNTISFEANTSGLLAYIKDNNVCKLERNNFLHSIPSVNGHFVKKHLFIRDCYVQLQDVIFKEGEKFNICVSGDPGIGKSYFSLYMFFYLVKKGQPVVRVGLGGSSLTFDGNEITFDPNGSGNDWRGTNVWLLLDGHANEKYCEKSKRGVVFASPKGSNFHKFIKAR